MLCGKSLQGCKSVPYQQEIGLLVVIHVIGKITYHKIPYSAVVQFADVVMAVVAACDQCKEKGFGGETEGPAVCQEP